MNEIQRLQDEISQRIAQLNDLLKNEPPTPVKNYNLDTLDGSVSLRELFANKSTLFAILRRAF